LTTFPDSEKAPFSIFMQGYIYANELINHDSASVLYRKFIDLYPDHEMLESVKFELKYLGLGINEIPELKHLIE
jgi:TolA-binding protein